MPHRALTSARRQARDAGLALAVILLAASPVSAGSQTIRQYQPIANGESHRLEVRQVPRPSPGPGEVLVRVRAVSLNHRDLYVRAGRPRGPGGMVPTSDGAGEVIAPGPGTSRFRVGDRVAGTLFADWTGGRRTPAANASARGGAIDGMLSEMVVSHENGLVAIPEHLSYEEAATLPCAAVTAWTARFTHGRLAPGDFVLLEGTGGVSVFGLQFAVAAGARPIITSSSDGPFGTAGIYVGSRDDFEAMNAFIARHRLRPVIDRVFPFEEVPAAYDYLESGAHLGKIVIRV